MPFRHFLVDSVSYDNAMSSFLFCELDSAYITFPFLFQFSREIDTNGSYVYIRGCRSVHILQTKIRYSDDTHMMKLLYVCF